VREPQSLARPLSLRAYRAGAAAASVLAPAILRARARRGKEDPERLGERLGRSSVDRPNGHLAWLHGASVGECVSLLPLIGALRDERPDLAILLTSGTRASAEVMARRMPAGVIHQYAPIDTPGAVARFLEHWRPWLGIFVESELWPNLVLGARAEGARLALVSARLTRKTDAWRASPAAIAAMLGSFDVILAQDAETERRVLAFGGQSTGRLNLKRLGAPLPVDSGELERLRAAAGDRTVIAAVSTHAPEERLIAAVARDLPGDPLIVFAPRHPERGPRIAAELSQALGPEAVALRSACEPITPATRAYVADTLNELGLFLRLTRLAIVGKSFGPETGGHNPLEPARLGAGVISGPAVANFADIYSEMAASGGAIIVEDGAGLSEALATLIGDEERLATLARAALAFAEDQEGQLGAALAVLRPLLPKA